MLFGKYEKIQNAIPSDADGILLTSEISQYYATGFELQDGYVLVTKDKTYLLCDFRYTESAKEHCKDKIFVDESSRLGEILADENIKTQIENTHKNKRMLFSKLLFFLFLLSFATDFCGSFSVIRKLL